MKVICAGLFQTGTESLAIALKILGYKLYSYDHHVSLHLEPWAAALKGSKDQLNFSEMYQGIEAVCDPPLCLYLQKLMKDFPDAKVILTVQDSEELWLKDCKEFLHPSYTGISGVKQFISEKIPRYLLSHLSPTMQNYVSYFESPLFKELLGTEDFEDGELMKWNYREHNDIVRLTVPCEQLLIMNVKDGWQPLCSFLGCSIPDEPFPCGKNVSYSYQLLYSWSFGRKCFQEGFNNLCFFLFLVGFGILMALMFN